jgi:ParB-like nuclease domain.
MLRFHPACAAADLAPFFLSYGNRRFYLGDTSAAKWKGVDNPEHMQRFADRVLESVRRHGVRNPIVCTTLPEGGEILIVVRHGATRLWAARLLGLTLPVLCWDNHDALDWPEISKREALALCHTEHEWHPRGDYMILKARRWQQF